MGNPQTVRATPSVTIPSVIDLRCVTGTDKHFMRCISYVTCADQRAPPGIRRRSPGSQWAQNNTVIVVGVSDKHQHDLMNIAHTQRRPAPLSRFIEGGQEHCCKDTDDGNYDQQFDQCEPATKPKETKRMLGVPVTLLSHHVHVLHCLPQQGITILLRSDGCQRDNFYE